MSEQLNVAAGGGPINAPRFQANSFHVMSTPTEISILGLSQVIGQSAAGDMELGHMPVFMVLWFGVVAMSESASNMRVSYDDEADVLYLTLGVPSRDHRSFEGPAGIVWRRDERGLAHGATLIDFHRYWMNHTDMLRGLIASNFNLALPAIEDTIAQHIH